MRIPWSAVRVAAAATAILLVCGCRTVSPLRLEYPKAGATLDIVGKCPLLEQALLDKTFFDRLDDSAEFRESVWIALEDRRYRTVGSIAPVRYSLNPGNVRERASIVLDYQTTFDYFAELPSGGGGRDAMMQRTIRGGTDDPNAMIELTALLKKNKETRSNERAKLKPEFNALAKKYIPETDLVQVRAEVRAILDDLVKAFAPYGATVLENPLGHYGVKIADHLYIHIRDFAVAPEERSNGLRHPHDAFFSVVLSGGPKPLPTDFLPAFPGAEGYGAMATGGRGGRVIYVTSANPSGPGSLAEALNTPGPRIVLFRISGPIPLPDDCWVTEPDMTVAGNTAPGEGVEIQGRLDVAASNLVFRYLRFRLRPPLYGDSLNTRGTLSNVVFDHCSFAYDSDENLRFIGGFSTFSNYTIQHCILGPGLAGLGSHPYGCETGGCGTIHHNVFLDTLSRTPEAAGDFCDLRNNIVYNCRSGHARRPWTQFNYVNNLVIGNPEVPYSYSFNCAPNVFASGNLVRLNDLLFPFGIAQSDYLKGPYPTMPITEHKPEEIETVLLPTVGASLPVRDATDAWSIEGLKTRQGRIPYYDNPQKEWEKDARKKRMSFDANPGMYVMWDPEKCRPPAAGARPAADSDNDGMPDKWERTHRLNPGDPSDGSADPDLDGYTNVEEWINGTDPIKYVDYWYPKAEVIRLRIGF
ncbi:hypothetical protein JW916_13065 [Candidatus Sumerlaeota bacterium]|nr:hypothetical protein [Candidatus Sumerlaeota bacterium]